MRVQSFALSVKVLVNNSAISAFVSFVNVNVVVQVCVSYMHVATRTVRVLIVSASSVG